MANPRLSFVVLLFLGLLAIILVFKIQPTNWAVFAAFAISGIIFFIDTRVSSNRETDVYSQMEILLMCADYDIDNPDSVYWARKGLPPYEEAKIGNEWYNAEKEWFAVIYDEENGKWTMAFDADRSKNPKRRVYKCIKGDVLTEKWAKEASLKRKKTTLDEIGELMEAGHSKDEALEIRKQLKEIETPVANKNV